MSPKVPHHSLVGPVALADEPEVHLVALTTRLDRRYACGLTWPRELWGNIRQPRETTNPGETTCAECLKEIADAKSSIKAFLTGPFNGGNR